MWFRCDKEGHKLFIENKKQQRLAKETDRHGNPRAVCPHCRPENVRLVEFKPDEKSWLEEYSKEYACSAGHIVTIYPFKNGTCNISWEIDGEKHSENVAADPETMMDLLEDGVYKCPHKVHNQKTGRKRKCNRKLKSVNGEPLAAPEGLHGIKTSLRLEDYWRRNGINADTKTGEYDGDGKYHETEFDRRQKRRMKSMRKKAKRVTERKGEVIEKATKRRYGKAARPSKGDVNYPDKPVRE